MESAVNVVTWYEYTEPSLAVKVLSENSPSRKEPSEWVISALSTSTVRVPLVKLSELTCGLTTRTVPLPPCRGLPLAAWLCPPFEVILSLLHLRD